MSIKFLTVLLFALFAFTLGKLRKTKCVALLGDCDLTSYCCGDYQCRDYRCATKDTKENQVEWANKGGLKCDWFHHCKKNYSCQSHRCIPDIKEMASEIKKTITGTD